MPLNELRYDRDPKMKDLHKALMTRLWRVANQYDGLPPDAEMSVGEMNVFGWLADECIRQMEWAYGQGGRGEFWVDELDGMRRLVDASEMPITLAPEDWTP